MARLAAAALLLLLPSLLPSLLAAQERRNIPKDSELISIAGCSRDRTFIVGEAPDHEPIGTSVAPGRRFRMSGPKAILDDIKRREGMMVALTGLVKKSDLSTPAGIRIFGGRVRIGGGQPQAPLSDVQRNSQYTEVVIDVEAYRMLLEPCSSGR